MAVKKKSKKQVAEEARALEARREYLTEYLQRVDEAEVRRMLDKYQHRIEYLREWLIPYTEMELAIIKEHMDRAGLVTS